MLKRFIILLCCLVFSVSLIAGTMFATDYYRCANLKKPIFAQGVADTLYDDGGSGTYRGPGYTIVLEGQLTAEYGYVVESVEMYLLGRFVFGAIT